MSPSGSGSWPRTWGICFRIRITPMAASSPLMTLEGKKAARNPARASPRAIWIRPARTSGQQERLERPEGGDLGRDDGRQAGGRPADGFRAGLAEAWQLRALMIIRTSAPAIKPSASTAGATTLTIQVTPPVRTRTSASAPWATTRSTVPAIRFRALRPRSAPGPGGCRRPGRRPTSRRAGRAARAAGRPAPGRRRAGRRVAPPVGSCPSTTAGKTLRSDGHRPGVGRRPARQDVERRPLGRRSARRESRKSRSPARSPRRAVGDVEHRDRLGPLDRAEPVDQGVPAVQVERRDRLVAEQEPGPGRQRPGQADPLPLAARERRRPTAEQVPDPAERRRPRPSRASASRRGQPLQAEPDVRRDAQVREQQVVLEDHADPPRPERAVDPRRGVEQDRRRRAGRSPGRAAPARRSAGGSSSCPPPTGPKTTPHSRPSRSATSSVRPGMDPMGEPDLEDAGGAAQRPGPRAGQRPLDDQDAPRSTPSAIRARAGRRGPGRRP